MGKLFYPRKNDTEAMMLEPSYFYEVNKFPHLQLLVENWHIIRDEFLALPTNVMNIDRVGSSHEEVLERISQYVSDGNSYGWIPGWGKEGVNYDWIQFGIIAYDEPIPFLGKYMPETVGMLKKIPGIKVAALSTLRPQASLPCHSHPEIAKENLLQFHLPLKTAATNNYTYINVAGSFRQHICGVPIIFNGSHDHFVLNESTENRTILYLEFKNFMP